MPHEVKVDRLRGLITEKDFPEVERQNPGFVKWFEDLPIKTQFFLNAYWAFLDFQEARN